ncbi:MAG: hypothetical protein IPJ40_18935 [Saprospirales bacterium]|nr:hypothetical protein [Saprospirales bacterium]
MISGNLEYLMNSLPNLSFQDTQEVRLQVSSILRKYAGPSVEEKSLIDLLDAEAEKFLTPGASNLLRQIELNTIHHTAFKQSKNKVLSAFSKYAFSLKDAIMQLRISHRKDVNQPSSQKQPLTITPGTPLEEEIQLLKLQWDKLEELSIGHYTDFSALVTYKLKLMILLRWWVLIWIRALRPLQD